MVVGGQGADDGKWAPGQSYIPSGGQRSGDVMVNHRGAVHMTSLAE